jgi:hypothetical protein
MHWFFEFIFGIELYMFRTVSLSIIRSLALYTQHILLKQRLRKSGTVTPLPHISCFCMTFFYLSDDSLWNSTLLIHLGIRVLKYYYYYYYYHHHHHYYQCRQICFLLFNHRQLEMRNYIRIVRVSYRKSWATIFCKVTCFIIDKPNTPP